MRLIEHIKAWNEWRKINVNSSIYKLFVLFGLPSPTFEMVKEVRNAMEEMHNGK